MNKNTHHDKQANRIYPKKWTEYNGASIMPTTCTEVVPSHRQHHNKCCLKGVILSENCS